MKPILIALIFAAIVAVSACTTTLQQSIQTEPSAKTQGATTEVQYEELAWADAPPCLFAVEVVIRDEQDYENARRRHGQLGPSVDFRGDGKPKSFTLPYTALDSNGDGKLGPEDFSISFNDNPVFIENGKIMPYSNINIKEPVPYEEVFTVDPVTGTITFKKSPQKLSVSAQNALLDEELNPVGWRKTGRKCTMSGFDFSKRTIIGNGVNGGGCSSKIEKNVRRNDATKEYIYTIKATWCGNCEMAIGSYEWISVPKIPADYTIKFNVEQERSENPRC